MNDKNCLACNGIQVLTPRPIRNRPGLSRLNYRIGTHAAFLETMLAKLASVEIDLSRDPAQKTLVQPLLGHLTARTTDDPSIATLDAWAMIADILTFYQERNANEGFLRTATQFRSIHELSRLVGYTPRQGLSSSVYLAFDVDAPQTNAAALFTLPTPGQKTPPPASDVTVTIPKGTQAKSTPLPGTGELPQTFETSQELIARPEWNAIRPRLTRPYEITATSLLQLEDLTFQGIGLRLNRGDYLAIRPSDLEGGESDLRIKQIESVEELPLSQQTRVTLRGDRLSNKEYLKDVRRFLDQLSNDVRIRSHLNIDSGDIVVKEMIDDLTRQELEAVSRPLTEVDLTVREQIAAKGEALAKTISGVATAIETLKKNILEGTNGSKFLIKRKEIAAQFAKDHEPLSRLGDQVTASDTAFKESVIQSTAWCKKLLANPKFLDGPDNGDSVFLGCLQQKIAASTATPIKMDLAFTSPDDPVDAMFSFGADDDAGFTFQVTKLSIAKLSTLVTEITAGQTVNLSAADKRATVLVELKKGTEYRGAACFVATSGDSGTSLITASPDLTHLITSSGQLAIVPFQGEDDIKTRAAADVSARMRILTDGATFEDSTVDPKYKYDVKRDGSDFRIMNLVPQAGNPSVSLLMDLLKEHPFPIKTAAVKDITIAVEFSDSIPADFAKCRVVCLRQFIVSSEKLLALPTSVVKLQKEYSDCDGADATRKQLHDAFVASYDAGGKMQVFSKTVKEGVVDRIKSYDIDAPTNTVEGLFALSPVMPRSSTAFEVYDRVFNEIIDVIKDVPKNLLDKCTTCLEQGASEVSQGLSPSAASEVINRTAPMAGLLAVLDKSPPDASTAAKTIDTAMSAVSSQLGQLTSDYVSFSAEVSTGVQRALQARIDEIVDRLRVSRFSNGTAFRTKPPEIKNLNDPGIRDLIYSKFDQILGPQGLSSQKDVTALVMAIQEIAGPMSGAPQELTWPDMEKDRVELIASHKLADLLKATLKVGGTAKPSDIDQSAQTEFEAILRQWKNTTDLLINKPNLSSSTPQTSAARLSPATIIEQLRRNVGGAAGQRGLLQALSEALSSRTGDDANSQSGLSTDILTALNPGEREGLIGALRDTRVGTKETNPRVFAFRTRTHLFGWNASRYIKKDDKLSDQELVSPNLESPGGADEQPDRLFLDSSFPKTIRDTVLAIRKPILSIPKDSQTPSVEMPFELEVEPRPYFIKSSLTAARNAFGKSGDVTDVRLAASWWQPFIPKTPGDPNSELIPNPSAFPTIQRSEIYCDSEELVLAESTLPDDMDEQGRTTFECDTIYPGFTAGKLLIVKGQRRSIAENVSESFGMLARITTVTHSVDLTLSGDRFSTRITFEPTIPQFASRVSLQLLANVTEATHGETVQEVLGNGDATRPYQAFQLKRGPVSRLPQPVTSGQEPELTVRVNDVKWSKVTGFDNSTEAPMTFTTVTGAEEQTIIVFGKDQARVPTGLENVRATYRAGLGLAGNVGANRIDQLSSPPRGVKSVQNPLLASGGANRDSALEARERAPLKALAPDRLVSVADFARFTSLFAGIGKATASELNDSVVVTIAAQDPGPIDPNSLLYLNLLQTLRLQADPLQKFDVVSRELALLFIAANIQIDPRYQWEVVRRQISETLWTKLHYDLARFGQDVVLSDVISIIHRIPGVTMVDIEKFDVIGEADRDRVDRGLSADGLKRRRRIEAGPARVLPATTSAPVAAANGSATTQPAGSTASTRTVGARLCYLASDVPGTLFLVQVP